MTQQRFHTPRTLMYWSTLADWLEVASQLQQRRSGSLNKQRKQLHVESLPLRLILECDDPKLLVACRHLLSNGPSGFSQPLRGQRGGAPHTPLIVAINNRIARLLVRS
jgi:hypothetical protein